LPREYAEQPWLGKPFKAQQLICTLSNLVEVPLGR
jgi:hypothetical protein